MNTEKAYHEEKQAEPEKAAPAQAVATAEKPAKNTTVTVRRIPKEARTAGQKKGYEPPITVTIITRTPRAIPKKKPEADKQS